MSGSGRTGSCFLRGPAGRTSAPRTSSLYPETSSTRCPWPWSSWPSDTSLRGDADAVFTSSKRVYLSCCLLIWSVSKLLFDVRDVWGDVEGAFRVSDAVKVTENQSEQLRSKGVVFLWVGGVTRPSGTKLKTGTESQANIEIC